MPFGLTNAPCTFQLLIQMVLRGLENFCLPYIDDVVIFSCTFDDHLTHIVSVLARLSQAGLTVKEQKCSWCFTSFDFLGFHVGKGCLSIPSSKVQSISNYVIPSSKHSLKSFLGLVTFYSKFIPNLACYTSVLTRHLIKDMPERLHCKTTSQKHLSRSSHLSQIILLLLSHVVMMH